MKVQVQAAFGLAQGMKDSRMVGVVAFCSDGCAFVVVHVWLDAHAGASVPATVIRSTDCCVKTASPDRVVGVVHSGKEEIFTAYRAAVIDSQSGTHGMCTSRILERCMCGGRIAP